MSKSIVEFRFSLLKSFLYLLEITLLRRDVSSIDSHTLSQGTVPPRILDE